MHWLVYNAHTFSLCLIGVSHILIGVQAKFNIFRDMLKHGVGVSNLQIWLSIEFQVQMQIVSL